LLPSFLDRPSLRRTYYFLTWTNVGGMLGWTNPASPGVEFKGFTVVNASYTTARWALTYTPQPVRLLLCMPGLLHHCTLHLT